MLRRRPAAIAGALTLLGITAGVALGANLGLFRMTQDQPPVGRLTSVGTDHAVVSPALVPAVATPTIASSPEPTTPPPTRGSSSRSRDDD